MSKKGFIERLVDLEGAALVLANITCGRVIGQIARGFGDDEEVRAQASLYLAIRAQYGEDAVVSIPVMFNRMLKNADDNTKALEGLDLTDEEKAEWAAQMGDSEADQLRKSVRKVADVMAEEGPTATIQAWYDLSPLAQHSLAVRTERNLWNAVKRYSEWTSESGAHLREVHSAAVEPLKELVSELCTTLKDDLDKARSEGVNVAQRAA